jgi:TP53 regulating kinase-like protein
MDTSALTLLPFYRGAEADLFLTTIGSWRAVIKRRIRKKYRNSSLDEQIRRDRTFSEASLLHQAKMTGARVPTLFGIDSDTKSIAMTYLSGNSVRESLDSMKSSEAGKLFTELGSQLGLLHIGGIVHGDLTTSNIIVTKMGVPFLVDFGMSRISDEPEDRGVDLHLLRRSIIATQTEGYSSHIKAVAQGYEGRVGSSIAASTFGKATEISRRGRYFALR